jgi:creatinine amidohydrolase
MNRSVFVLSLLLAVTMFSVSQQLPSRALSDLNWMDIRDIIPSTVTTVLLPTGTLEPHGVINNGADIIAPVAIASAIAERVNGIVAPVIPYGVTGSMDGFPGAFTVSEKAYRAYVEDVLRGLAGMGFREIVVINGHGGPQTDILTDLATRVGRSERVRTLVINWWSTASDVTQDVFGEDGGHAGWNETAFVQAIDPSLVHEDKYDDAMTMPNPGSKTWSAYPTPASITLYKAGEGLVQFDQAKADEYFRKVNARIADLVLDIRSRWNRADIP